MHLTEDQVWKLNELVKEEGYHGGLKVKRGLFKREGPIRVSYKDHNNVRWTAQIGSIGNLYNRRHP